jgi:hypothetical protein
VLDASYAVRGALGKAGVVRNSAEGQRLFNEVNAELAEIAKGRPLTQADVMDALARRGVTNIDYSTAVGAGNALRGGDAYNQQMAAYQRNAMENAPMGDYCDIYGNDSDNFYVDKHAEIKAVQQSTGYRYLLDKWDGISSSLEKARRDGSMLAGVGLMAYDFADGVVGLGRWVAGKFGANTGEHVFKYLDDAHRQQATIGGAMTGILSGIAGIAKNVAKAGAGLADDIDFALGRLGGKQLTGAEYKSIKETLSGYGVKTVYGYPAESVLPSKAAAGFGYGSQPTLYLRKGATQYETFHELMHAEQYLKLGSKEVYVAQGRYARESYVFNRIWQNRQKFQTSEIRDAIDYMRYLRTEFRSGRIN